MPPKEIVTHINILEGVIQDMAVANDYQSLITKFQSANLLLTNFRRELEKNLRRKNA